MRSFAVYILFLVELPRYLLVFMRAILTSPSFPHPDVELQSAMSADDFGEYFDNSAKAIQLAKLPLFILVLAGVALTVLFGLYFLVILALAIAAYLTFFYSLSHRIEVSGVEMLAKNYLDLWVSGMREAFDCVSADPDLNDALQRMKTATDANNLIALDEMQESIAPEHWHILRQALMLTMGHSQ